MAGDAGTKALRVGQGVTCCPRKLHRIVHGHPFALEKVAHAIEVMDRARRLERAQARGLLLTPGVVCRDMAPELDSKLLDRLP